MVVALGLALLLGDDDPITREHAARDLGQTRNPRALVYLRKALQDKHIDIRIAAVAAAGDIGLDEAAGIAVDALEATDASMLLAAMQEVRQSRWGAAGPNVRKLLTWEDPLIRAVALNTLTELKLSAAPSQLRTLLGDASSRVRVRAAKNASLLASVDDILAELDRCAQKPNPPAVRAAAVETLGKRAFNQSKSQELLTAAATDANPLLRCAAVRVYHHAGKAEPVRAFLDDPSSMVRFAAIQAAGDLKVEEGVSRLFELMLDAANAPTHLAARRALRQIGSEAVTDQAALAMNAGVAALEKAWAAVVGGSSRSKPAAGKSRTRDEVVQQRQLISRNISSCNWLMGELKSKKALALQLKILEAAAKKRKKSEKPLWEINSPVLHELVPALAKIGDPAAIDPLDRTLKKCFTRGQQYLIALAMMRPPPAYSEEVTGSVARALADLKAYQALDTMIQIAKTNMQGATLSRATSHVVRALPLMANDANRPKVEACLVEDVLSSNAFSLFTHFCAAKAVGRMKIKAALPTLRKMLNEERRGPRMMHAAAWAIQEITGQTPKIPQPRLRQGDWILRKIDR